MSGPVEVEVRSTRDDDDDSEYEYLDVLADELIEAIHNKDRSGVKMVFQALCEHIKEDDERRDHRDFEEKE